MATALSVQQRLHALGLYTGALDGKIGPWTIDAMDAALDKLAGFMPPPATSPQNVARVILAQPHASRPINEVVVHCTATPEGRPVTADEIRAWHKGRGWGDIGYHWVVRLDGYLEPGRPEAQVGAHVMGHNQGTLGIVYVGGVEADGKTPKDTRTPAQRATLLAAVKVLIAKYPTIKRVSGHNDHTNAKACPSFKVGNDPLGHLV